MADQTSSTLPYPELPDANNPPADIKALAEAIDAIYGNKSVANVAALPAAPNFRNQRIYIEDIDVLAWYDEKTGAWQGFARTYAPAVGGTAGENVANTTYLIEPSGMVEVDFNIVFAAGATATILMDLPPGIAFHADEAVGSGKALGIASLKDDSVGATSKQIAMVTYFDSDSVLFQYNASTILVGNVGSGGGATPWTWAINDSISGKFRFRRLGS